MTTNPNDLIVVCGGGRLHRRPSRRRSAAAGSPRSGRSTSSRSTSGISVSRGREPCLDLQLKEAATPLCAGAAEVYNLAADMGGMGFIEDNKGLCMLSVLINTHLLMAAREIGVERYFFASSACVYAADKQARHQRGPAEGSRRVSGDAGRRLRLGEAFQRAHVPALPRGLRRPNARARATTTSTGRTGRGQAAARKRRPRSAAR